MTEGTPATSLDDDPSKGGAEAMPAFVGDHPNRRREQPPRTEKGADPDQRRVDSSTSMEDQMTMDDWRRR